MFPQNLPTNIDDSKYYVFYYDASGNVQVKDFSNASDAQNFIDSTDFTVIGNAYVKITKTSDTEYTITAVGSESKYNNTNGGNTGDISAKFEVTQHWEKKEVGTSLRMSEKKFSTPPAASSTGFLTLGDQTAFSLLKSLIKSTSSFFPLVFDKALKITSSSGSRCRAIAYNNGIYLLGNYSGTDVKSSTGVDLQDICYYPNSDASYGCTLECKFLVIGGNMACKTSAGQKGAAVKYAGSDFATDKGVVIYFTKDNIICKNPNYKEAAVYNKGYYFLPIDNETINQTGIDLFRIRQINLRKSKI